MTDPARSIRSEVVGRHADSAGTGAAERVDLIADGEPWRVLAEDAPYRAGTIHIATPAQASSWARLAGRRVGVTSVSDLTDTHPMRIPVTQAIRPATTGEVRTMGKGQSVEGAVIGALMEAVERASAEVRPESPVITIADGDVARVPLDLLHRPPTPRPVDDDVPWVVGTTERTGERRAVPLEAVTLDWVVPQPDWAGRFRATSNGLAAGFTRTTAVLQGLCEVIERDAMALWDLAGADQQAASRIRPSTIEDPVCRSLLTAMAKAGLWVGVWDLTSAVGVPVIHAGTVARDPRSLGQGEVPAAGVGCHPNPIIAIRRALCEAAQSRVSALHGMDEMDPAAYAEARRLRMGALELLARDPVVDARTLADWSMASPATELDRIVEAVGDTLGSDVVVVDLTAPALPPVVKVMVPGTESSLRLPGWTPGPRARQLLEEQGADVAVALADDGAGAASPSQEGEETDALAAADGTASARIRHLTLVCAPVGDRRGPAVAFIHPDRIPSTHLQQWSGIDIRAAARPGDLVRAVRDGASAIALIDIDPDPRPRLRTSEGLHVLRAGVPLLGASGLGALLCHDLVGFGAIVLGDTAAAATEHLVVRDNALYRSVDSVDLPTVEAAVASSVADGDIEPEVASAFLLAVGALPWRIRRVESIVRALEGRAAAGFRRALVAARAQLYERDLIDLPPLLSHAPTPVVTNLPQPTTLWAAAMRWVIDGD